MTNKKLRRKEFLLSNIFQKRKNTFSPTVTKKQKNKKLTYVTVAKYK